MSQAERRRRGLFLTIVLAASPAYAEISLPEGWRLPGQADVSGGWAEFREGDRRPYHAQADFNGDGVIDDAYIAFSTGGPSWALFVNLNSRRGQPKIIKLAEDSGTNLPQNMGVAVAKRGTYKTLCGKISRFCKGGEPPVLKLRLPAINYYLFEGANSFFWWDKQYGKFRRTWMSD